MSEGLRPAVPAPLSALVISGCVALSGCGEDGTADRAPATSEAKTTPTAKEPATLQTARLESLLKRNLRALPLPAVPATIYPQGGGPPEQTQYGGGHLRVRSVTCPESVPLERGGRFTCDVDARKATGGVRMTQLDDRGRRLRYRASIKTEAAGGIPVTTNLTGKLKLE
jgi:hypothetical protein